MKETMINLYKMQISAFMVGVVATMFIEYLFGPICKLSNWAKKLRDEP